MSRAATYLLAVPVLGFFGLLLAAAMGQEGVKAEKIRIGTYDNRAIAIAYAGSRFNTVHEKMAEYEKAKAANDEAKMKELKAWGKEQQRLAHFQGFGRVPVDDLLIPVKDQVAKLAGEQRLAAITMNCDFAGAEVELVDVTDEMVKLYDPSEKVLRYVAGMRKIKPVPLVQLADMPAEQ